MTEDEAKEKWCPFVRIVGWEQFRDGEQAATCNRIPNKDGSIDSCVACIGSSCMAWRVSEPAKKAEYESEYIEWYDGDKKPESPSLEAGWEIKESGRDEPDEDDEDQRVLNWESFRRLKREAKKEKGYCGLAGKP